MDNTNSQAETQTPKFKVGDLVWVPIFGGIKSVKDFLFVQTTITALVYSRLDGKSTFKGYMTASEHQKRVVKGKGVFTTREDVEALIDRMKAEIDAEIKANKEGK